MAQPLRFRVSNQSWPDSRVRSQLLGPLQQNIGATSVPPRFDIGGDWRIYRFEMDNGDLALVAAGEDTYWLGNTETPQALWRTDKFDWTEVPYQVSRWAQRELLDTLHERTPWLEAYPHISWFFLPVFLSKDGRESTRTFFEDHAAGFPDTGREQACAFFEEFLRTGVLDPYRYEMAGKLGTSTQVDLTRMRAAMAEFITAKLLTDAGYEITPEIEVTTGHSLDFRASTPGQEILIEVTRPVNPRERAATSAVAAVRETATTKTSGQLAKHAGGAALFLDCTNFDDRQWREICDSRPALDHKPAVVYRARPTEGIEGYQEGSLPLDLTDVLAAPP